MLSRYRRFVAVLVVTFVAAAVASPAWALDDEHWQKADAAVERGIAYLRTTQSEDGSWSPRPGPAITAMVVRVMLTRPDISHNDPAVATALDYVMSKAREDGGIHDGFLENYNTAISLSALALVNSRPDVAVAITRGQDYLRGLQWAGQIGPDGKVVDESHPFYGGAGYGKHGRPDMSNTQIMLQGLHDSGLDCNDPAFQRAMVFISRCQGIESNDLHGDKIQHDGGFIYATSINKDLVGVPESKASPELIDEAKQGRPVSGLRTYGSITYAGFKSYVYADLDRDDPRVRAAYDWIRNNYDLGVNPGMTDNPKTEVDERLQGLFYYYMTFSRALDAFGPSTLTTADGERREWANDLIAHLVELQNDDGSWGPNSAERWMEGDRNLVTAYALIALQHAME